MSLTILDVLRNAQHNLCADHPNMFQIALGKSQLNNALILLDKGLGLYDDFDEQKLEE